MIRALAVTLLLTLASAAGAQGRWLPDDAQGIPETDRSNFQAMTSTTANGALVNIERVLGLLQDTNIPNDPAEARAKAQTRQAQINEFNRAYDQILSESHLAQTVAAVDEDERWVLVWDRLYELCKSKVVKGSDVHLAWLTNFDARAAVDLENAVNHLDFARLFRISQRFPLSPSAYAAASHASALAFERGDFAALAQASLKALECSPFSDDSAANLSLVIARGFYAARILGWQTHAQAFEAAAKPFLQEPVMVGDAPMALRDWLASVRAEFKEKDSLLAPPDARVAISLPHISGLPTTRGLKVVSEQAWPTLALPAPTSDIMDYRLDYLAPEVSPILPTSDGTTILVNSGEALSAFDFFSGKPIWYQPFSLTAPNDAFHYSEQDPNLILTAAKYQDLAIAALENPLSRAQSSPRAKPAFMTRVYSTFPIVRRSLVAVDVTTGKERWRLGGSYQEASTDASLSELEKEVATTSFLTMTIVDGTIYAIGSTRENESRLYLVAIDPLSGKPLWNLLLGAGQGESNMFGNPMREAIPGIPVYAEGVLYLASNLGATMAVDLEARSILWISRYQAMPRPYTRMATAVYRKVTFANGAPTLTRLESGEQVLIVAPTDSRFITCYRASDGTTLWSTAIETAQPYPDGRSETGGQAPREPTVFVGVHGKYAYVAYVHFLTRLLLSTGAEAGTAAIHGKEGTIEVTSKITGRPTIAGDMLYWPGMNGLSEVAISERELPSQPLAFLSKDQMGNLSVFNGALFNLIGKSYVSNGTRFAGHLQVRFDALMMLAQAEEAAKADPTNPLLKLRIVQLAEKSGGRSNYDEAAIDQLLREVIELSKDDATHADTYASASRTYFDRIVHRASLASRKSDGPGFLKAIQEARGYISNESQERDLFTLEEDYALLFGDAQQLQALYLRMADSGETFELSIQGVGYPAHIFGRWLYAGGLAAEGKMAEALAAYDKVVGWALTNAEKKPILAQARRMIAEIVAKSPEAYAALVQAAQQAEKNAQGMIDTRAALELTLAAERYDHAPNRLALLKLALQHAERQATFDAIAPRVFAVLRGEAMSAKSAELLIALLQRYADNQNALGAWQVFSTLKRFDQTLKVRLGDESEPKSLGTIVGEMGISKLVGNNVLGTRKMRLPLKATSAWEDTPQLESDGVELDAARLLLVSNVIGEDRLAFASLTFVTTPAGTGRFQLLAFDAATGKEEWRAENVTAELGIAKVQDTYAVFSHAQVVGLDAKSGRERWRVSPQTNLSTVEVVAGMAILTYNLGRTFPPVLHVLVLDCRDGKQIWESAVGDYATSGIGINGSWLYTLTVVESGTTKVSKLSMIAGEVVETRSFEGVVGRSTPIIFGENGELVIASRLLRSGQNEVVVLDGETLATLHRHAVKRGTSPAIAVDSGILLLVDDSGYVEARELLSDTVLWSDVSKPGLARVDSRYASDGKLVLVWSPEGRSHAIWTTVYDVDSGERLFHAAIWEPAESRSVLQATFEVIQVANGFVLLVLPTEKVTLPQGQMIRNTPAQATFFDANTFKANAAPKLKDAGDVAFYTNLALFVPTKGGFLVSDGLSKMGFFPSDD